MSFCRSTVLTRVSPRLLGLRWNHEKAADAVSKSASNDGITKGGEARLGEKEKRSAFGGRSTVPININFPNPRNIEGWEEREFELSEVVKDGPALIKQHVKDLAKEIRTLAQEGSVEKTQALEDMGLLKDGEARVEFRFNSPEALALWHTGCDSDWHEGHSKMEWVPTRRGTAIFRGDISSRIVKDGRVERAGWASIKLEDKAAFNRRKYLSRWTNFSHLLVKCRGDGRSYKIMLHAPLTIDMTWGDSFSYPLHTHGGPYWQYERIPFSKFFHTVAGRIQDKQQAVHLLDVSSISFVLMDRIDGPFQLEMDWVGVCHDRSHLEKFAYETYTLPLFNSSGF